MEDKIPFLGTGWKFPPSFSKDINSIEMVSDEEDIQESLCILLSTSIGERILQPTYGCDLKKMLYEPLNTTVEAYIKDLVKSAILYFEPRIKLDNVRLEVNSNEGILNISVEYTVRTTNSRNNYVFPFYLNEGSGESK